MGTIIARGSVPQPSHGLTPQSALQQAWIYWITLLCIPFFVFLYVVWQLTRDSAPEHHAAGQTWFIVSMAYILVAAPASQFWRSHLFKPYWRGEVVPPRQYLMGMVGIWLVLEIGGLLGLAGCLATHAILPNLLPALVAFGFFLPLWPSGGAMDRPVGGTDDHATYKEPR
jgi:hypothetical protein